MKKTDRYWIIGVSFLPAIILAMIPLPTWLQPWRPSWVPMVLAYWCMALPDHVSLLVVWGVGLLLDIYQGRLLGINSLCLVLFSFVVIAAYRRLRVLSTVHQLLYIFLYLFLYESFVEVLAVTLGEVSWDRYWALPALSSLLFWTLLFNLLRRVRRKYIRSG